MKIWLKFVCFDSLAVVASSSAPEAKLVNKMSTKISLKLNRHMLQTLTSNVQFWGSRRFHWTKLYPKLGDSDLNSIKLKKNFHGKSYSTFHFELFFDILLLWVRLQAPRKRRRRPANQNKQILVKFSSQNEKLNNSFHETFFG